MIRFHSEDSGFRWRSVLVLRNWLNGCLRDFNLSAGEINIIAISPEAIRVVNKQWLNHDYATDVITFKLTGKRLTADVYLCPEVIRENSTEHAEDFERELHRCLVHGFLHLVGFDDASDDERVEMRSMEDVYLQKLEKLFHVKQS